MNYGNPVTILFSPFIFTYYSAANPQQTLARVAPSSPPPPLPPASPIDPILRVVHLSSIRLATRPMDSRVYTCIPYTSVPTLIPTRYFILRSI